MASLLAVERRKLRKITGDAKVERTGNGEGKLEKTDEEQSDEYVIMCAL